MRKLLPSIILALALYSCGKDGDGEPVSCWRCTVTAVAMADTARNTTHDTLCDRTKAQIDAYEKAGSWQAGRSSTGLPYGTFYAGGYSSVTTDCGQIK